MAVPGTGKATPITGWNQADGLSVVTGSFSMPRNLEKKTTASSGNRYEYVQSKVRASLTAGKDGHIVNAALAGRKKLPLNLVPKQRKRSP